MSGVMVLRDLIREALQSDHDPEEKRVALIVWTAANDIYHKLVEEGWTDRRLRMHQVQVLADWLGAVDPKDPTSDRSFSDALENAGSPAQLIRRLYDGVKNVLIELSTFDVKVKGTYVTHRWRQIVAAMRYFEKRGAKRPTSSVPGMLKRLRHTSSTDRAGRAPTKITKPTDPNIIRKAPPR